VPNLQRLHTQSRRTLNDNSREDPKDTETRDQVVHEFKNQLAVVLGFCDLLLAELADDDPRRTDIQQMHEAGHAALALLPRLFPPRH
jgi:hypothetical protein